MGTLKHLTIPVDNEYKGGDRVLVEHIYNQIRGRIHSGLATNPTFVSPGVYKEELTGLVTISKRLIYITSRIHGCSNLYSDSPEMVACKSHGVKVTEHAKDSYRVIRKLSWLEYQWRKFRSLFVWYEDQGFGFWQHVWHPNKTIKL